MLLSKIAIPAFMDLYNFLHIYPEPQV